MPYLFTAISAFRSPPSASSRKLLVRNGIGIVHSDDMTQTGVDERLEPSSESGDHFPHATLRN